MRCLHFLFFSNHILGEYSQTCISKIKDQIILFKIEKKGVRLKKGVKGVF